jgi:hypothetical protein
MSWQDIVLSGGIIIFCIALIPSILSNNKPALTTSVVTGIFLVMFTVTYASLDLWFAAAVTALNAALWLTLAVQKAFFSK